MPPRLDVCAIVGAKAQRRVQIAGVAEHNVVVTSYDLMRRDIDEYIEQDFARVVLDEAQYIKNPLRTRPKGPIFSPPPGKFLFWKK